MEFKLLKTILSVIVTIILGAIANGLWERIMSPLLDKIVNFSIISINYFFNTYKDSIYAEASNGFHEFYSLQLYTLFLLMLPLSYIILLKIHPLKKQRDKKNKKSNFLKSDKGYKFLIALTILVTIFYLFSVLRYKYINKTITYSMKSMKIIRPYISEKEYHIIYSQYCLVKDTNDFVNFYIKINNIAEKNNLILGTFKPL